MILISLFRDYFASESQKNALEKILNKNQEMLEQMKKEKYSVDNNLKTVIDKNSFIFLDKT